MNFRKVRRICNVRGCRNTDCYAVSRSRETGYSVIMCADCIKDAFNTLTEKENAVYAADKENTAAEQAETGAEITETGAESAETGAEQAADEPVRTAAAGKKAAAKKKTAAKESE